MDNSKDNSNQNQVLWLEFCSKSNQHVQFHFDGFYEHVGRVEENEQRELLVVPHTNIRKLLFLKQNQYLTKQDTMVYTNVSFRFRGAQIHIFLCKTMLRFESWSHGFFFLSNAYFVARNLAMNLGQMGSLDVVKTSWTFYCFPFFWVIYWFM
jgi:hypothetical protein